MPFESVAPFRLYQQVADQIEGLIRSGELAAGQRLPSERDLAAKLSVSRPTIREAMIALEIAGLVEVRTGSGIFVTVPSATGTHGFEVKGDVGTGPLELIDARLVLETAIAAQAARTRTDADLAALDASITAMRRAADTAAHRQADRAFHAAIATATRNGVLISLVEGLWGDMFSPLFERLGHLTGLFPDTQQSTIDDHEAIVAAIRAGDAEAASGAMGAHLAHVRDKLLQNAMDAGEGGTDAAA